jgi:hypothetical protein
LRGYRLCVHEDALEFKNGLLIARIVLAETYRKNGLPFGQMFSTSSAARNIVARKSLPEFLDNMLRWMVPLGNLFIKMFKFIRPRVKPCRRRSKRGALFIDGGLPTDRVVKQAESLPLLHSLHL